MSIKQIPAITIHQPWAELIITEKKQIEVRKWFTDYRGSVLLHVGLKTDEYAAKIYNTPSLFHGGFIGIFEISAIVPFDEDRWIKWKDKHRDLGNYQSGLFAWIISNVKRFEFPVMSPGQQGLFYPTDQKINEILNRNPGFKNGW